MYSNDYWDGILNKIIDLIPDKSKYMILLIDGKNVDKDSYHQADNLTNEEVFIITEVLKNRTIELSIKDKTVN